MKELGSDGPILKGIYAENRLKLFYQRDKFFYSLDDVESDITSKDSISYTTSEELSENDNASASFNII